MRGQSALTRFPIKKSKNRMEEPMRLLVVEDERSLREDIAKKLMRSYDVRIEVADSLRDRRFYGDFMINKNTIEEVLETIASTSRMNYRYENGKYILY